MSRVLDMEEQTVTWQPDAEMQKELCLLRPVNQGCSNCLSTELDARISCPALLHYDIREISPILPSKCYANACLSIGRWI